VRHEDDEADDGGGDGGEENAGGAGVLGEAEAFAALEGYFVGEELDGGIERKRRDREKEKGQREREGTGIFYDVKAAAAYAIAFLARLDYVSGQVFTLDSRMDPHL
jgi:hypothetical protein